MKSNQKHLTLSDRIYIEQELLQKTAFYKIANTLKKDSTTISKEVKLNYRLYPSDWRDDCKKCSHYVECDLTRDEMRCALYRESYICKLHCKKCRHKPTERCPYFKPFVCERIGKPPYVCNCCVDRDRCPFTQKIYEAKFAQRQYEKRLVESRRGLNLTPEELIELNELISPLVLKGQPLSHIFATHSDEIPVSRRTLYNYFEQRIFQAKNIDLPRRVRYKKRKKQSEPRINKGQKQVYRNKRTYVDFKEYLESHPGIEVVEMDTVKGGRKSGKCLLTLLFRSCSFMIIILLPNCTQNSVIAAINNLTELWGWNTFKKSIPVILTDNGSEFKNPWDIEKTVDGKTRTQVFYCDPYISNQKARIEKNHEYIRYIIPKGRSMYRYTQEDINLMASHINSTARDSLNGATPFDLAELLLDKKIPVLAGQIKVSPDDVMLKPELIDHREK